MGLLGVRVELKSFLFQLDLENPGGGLVRTVWSFQETVGVGVEVGTFGGVQEAFQVQVDLLRGSWGQSGVLGEIRWD